jgi:hypothetical protein
MTSESVLDLTFGDVATLIEWYRLLDQEGLATPRDEKLEAKLRAWIAENGG